jgi:hypothetical protein
MSKKLNYEELEVLTRSSLINGEFDNEHHELKETNSLERRNGLDTEQLWHQQ